MTLNNELNNRRNYKLNAKWVSGLGRYRNAVVLLLMLAASALAHAQIEPVFTVNKAISFGTILFTQGNCVMDPLSGRFTTSAPATMCGSHGAGTPGHYVIIASPNQQVQITVHRRENRSDGLFFTPSGQIATDQESIELTPDVMQQINSGISGVVTLRIGGSLHVSSPLNPSQHYNLIKEEGIEWRVLSE